MFKNKHIIVAMIVAPILAIIGYFATDYFVSEKPHVAIEGQSYELVAKSNCRYESGKCTLENGDIRIEVKADTSTATDITLSLQSNIPLMGASVAIDAASAAPEPTVMTQTQENALNWQARMSNPQVQDPKLRLVVGIAGSTYYAETGMVFANFETGFSRENWGSTNRQ